MAISASDILFYAAANKPIDDVSTGGGAIDPDERVVFTDLASPAAVEALSSNGGDTTQTLTVYGRKADGSFVSESVALDGTNVVSFSTIGTLERVERALLDGDAAGTVTLRVASGGATVGTIPAGERGFRRLFINAISDPSSPKPYYEKIFIKNAHGSLALLSAIVTESADPSGKVTFCLAASVDDSATNTDRLTSPGGSDLLDPDTFDGGPQSVPGTNLAAGSAIGVWVKLSLSAAEAPIKSTWTPQIAGSST
jgi:hypothetical protein